MEKLGGTKSWVVTVGVTLLLAFVVVPALSSAASATPATSETPAVAAPPWAYCGNGTWSNTITSGNTTLSWDASYAWCTIFHATNTGPGVWMLELNRTLGMKVQATLSDPSQTLKYDFAAMELDAAFANVTNDSTVYVAGQPVPALGLLNASTFDQSSVDQSFSDTNQSGTASASLTVNGNSNGSVSFAPSLGLIPLNLTGVDQWNSTSTASASAAWQVDWAWSHTPFSGAPTSGSGSHSGNLSGSFVVQLTGFKAPVVLHPFVDGKARMGVVLVIQGPFDLRDGFVLVPHDFDLFGGASQSFEADSMGSANVASGETLYLTQGVSGPEVTAASSSFGMDDSTINAGGPGLTGVSPAASVNPSGTVMAQPTSVTQAQSESNQIAGHGTMSPSSHPLAAGLIIGLVVAAVVVVAVLGVLGWRSHAQRRASERMVARYPGYGPNGVPPAVMAPPPAQGPTAPAQGPGSVEDPNRRL